MSPPTAVRVAGESVCAMYFSLRDVAAERYAEVEMMVRDYFEARDRLEPVTREDLLARTEEGSVLLLDVRPAEEFSAGHIPGAVSLPLGQLEERLVDLSPEIEIIAYCRGPYCVLAPQALDVLHRNGFTARRLQDGLPEWRQAGLPVEVGTISPTG